MESETIKTSPSWTFPSTLLALYVVLFVVCAIDPYDRLIWLSENVPVWLVVGTLIYLAKRCRFSNTAYALMAVFVMLHTIGGHYSFARVPFDWVTELFDFERNHFDRVAHFSVGFYAYAIAELLVIRRLVGNRWLLALFPLFSIITVAGLYEVVEWQFAVAADPATGIAALGSQGDVWDAQKDILADTLGALLVLTVFFRRHRTTLGTLKNA